MRFVALLCVLLVASAAAASVSKRVAPDVVKPAQKSEDGTAAANADGAINDKNDASNGGGLKQNISGKKSHVTVIANTNKLFQIETPDGRTIDQYRDGGETVDGQSTAAPAAAASTADDAETVKDLQERREKRERRDRDFQEKMKGTANGQGNNDNGGFDLSNMCALAKDSCPDNWEDKGTVGVMLSDDKYDQVNPFTAQGEGANPDVGYKWTHPKLCCATSDKATVANLYLLSRSCPNGNMDLIGGVTYLTSRYDRNPFQKEAGHDYNKFWRWIHPYICRLDNGNDDLKSKHRSCFLAKQCAGQMRDFGFTGLIVKLADADKQPFQLSEEKEFQEYKGWRWAHPKLCCNPNGE